MYLMIASCLPFKMPQLKITSFCFHVFFFNVNLYFLKMTIFFSSLIHFSSYGSSYISYVSFLKSVWGEEKETPFKQYIFVQL